MKQGLYSLVSKLTTESVYIEDGGVGDGGEAVSRPCCRTWCGDDDDDDDDDSRSPLI